MTRDDIIRMAREAGWPDSLVSPVIMAKLAEFAALVEAKAAAAEREACAKVCEELEPNNRYSGEWIAGWSDGTDDCATAIRARGQS